MLNALAFVALLVADAPPKTAASPSATPAPTAETPVSKGLTAFRLPQPWGSTPSATLRPTGRKVGPRDADEYIREPEASTFLAVPVAGISYGFIGGRFREMTVFFRSDHTATILGSLKQAWGPPWREGETEPNWVSARDTTMAILFPARARDQLTKLVVFDAKFAERFLK